MTDAYPLTDSDIEQRLQRVGVTPTAQRMDVARVLFEREQHLSADQLMERLKHRGCHRVSKATVYNTLGLFARVGLVRQVFADPTRVHYDSNVTAHHHLYDLDTGTLTDIASDSIQLHGLPPLADGVELAGVDVIVKVRSRRD